MIKRSILVLAVFFLLIVPINAQKLSLEKSVISRSSIISGEIVEGIYEDFQGYAKTEKFISADNGNLYKINSRNSLEFNAGERVTASGTLSNDEITLRSSSSIKRTSKESGSNLSPVKAQVNSNLGPQKLVVILVNYQDEILEPLTKEEVNNLFFAENSEINSWIKEASYNRAYLEGDVYGWYVLPINKGECSGNKIRNLTVTASDNDIDFTKYDRMLIVFPQSSCTSFSTVGKTIMRNSVDGHINMSYSFLMRINTITAFDGVAVHELGHQFGNRHSHDWECGSSMIYGICTYQESPSWTYPDFYDIMGPALTNNNKGHFNLIHKLITGWIKEDEIKTVSKYGAGIYKIAPIELSQSRYPKGIKIPANDTLSYYIEYRQPVLNDYFINSYGDGAILHMNFNVPSGLIDSLLIDGTPHEGLNRQLQVDDSEDSVLRVNTLFHDPINNVKIIPLQVTPEYLEVCVGLDTVEQCNTLRR